ncbi:MAG: hypothetical protein ACRCS8_06150 [Brevinema sp.]
MKYFILILVLLPINMFADLFVDFGSLSYTQVIKSLEKSSLSNTRFIVAHPYQKYASTNTYMSDVLTNYHRKSLDRLENEAQKENSKIYFSIDRLEMHKKGIFTSATTNRRFIPNFNDKKEIKSLINRLILISQTNRFGLKINLASVPEKHRKSLETQIRKAIPNSLFVNGVENSISDHEYNTMKETLSKLQNPKIVTKQRKKSKTTHLILEKEPSGISISSLFWYLSRKESVLISYQLLSHQYILQVVEFLQGYDKSFKIYHLDPENLMLISPNYLLNIHLANKLVYRTINKSPLETNIMFKSMNSSSIMFAGKKKLEFIAWPYSVFVWKYK